MSMPVEYLQVGEKRYSHGDYVDIKGRVVTDEKISRRCMPF